MASTVALTVPSPVPESTPQDVWIVNNAAWNVYNFRAGLIRGLQEAGYAVTVCCPADSYLDRMKGLGVRHVDLPFDAAGTNPLREARVMLHLLRIFRTHRPAALLSFTPKINIYVALVAGWLHLPVIANISGLGRAFLVGGWIELVSRALYRLALRTTQAVFFQNPDDLQLFVQAGMVRASLCQTLPGSGIDLERFAPVPPMAGGTAKFRFLLLGRMLWDKGVKEYVEAARMVKSNFGDVEFGLLGFVAVNNPAAIKRSQIDHWQVEGLIRYYEATEDVRPHLAASDCVVLPSYREGTPRALLEAASMGIPVITTDTVGCRQVVDDAVSGFLCRPKDPQDLANKMIRMIEMHPAARQEMGRCGRRKMEREFDQKLVVERYLLALRQACPAPAAQTVV